MAANARLVVQMTPKEKRALDARARLAGVSTSEFVRRRVTADDLSEHRAEIETLLATLEASAPAILKSVEGAIATATKLNARPDSRSSAKRDSKSGTRRDVKTGPKRNAGEP